MNGWVEARGGAVGSAMLLGLPPAVLVYFAFNSGGIFEVTTAFGAVVVLAVLVVALALSPRPLAGLRPRGLVAIVLLALFGAWILHSGGWPDTSGRASVSFDRLLLYLGLLAIYACLQRSDKRFRWLLRGLFLGAALVALVGLTSRLLPSAWPTSPGLVSDRLGYPITYWNSFGLLAGMACILCFHHASDEREPAWVRVGAAALLPLLGTALFLSFSRGAIAVTLLAILVYAVAARPRGLPGALLAVAPACAIALVAANSATLVHDGTPLTSEALSQAHGLAWALAGCAVLAAGIRAVDLWLDKRLAALSVPKPAARRAWLLALGAATVALLAFVLAGGTSKLQRQYERFVDQAPVSTGGDGGQGGRLLDLGNDGRLPLWEVAGDAFAAHPLTGVGAGGYQLQWQKHRAVGEAHERIYAYSLYLETLAELGIVGMLLLGGALLTLLIGAAVLIRGPTRAIYAAGFAVLLAAVLHAGLDIDWQMPVVCVPVFVIGGLALARPAGDSSGEGDDRPAWLDSFDGLAAGSLRPVLALACIALAVLPAKAAIGHHESQAAVAALDARDCGTARDRANDAIAATDTGPRPYEVLAICAAREGRARVAVHQAGEAVSHDPASWEPQFVLALVRGSAGLDPRRQVRRALAANPSRYLLRLATRELGGSGPRRWRQTARTLPFAIE